ncbi:cryptochrome 2 [Wolffia australiana]
MDDASTTVVWFRRDLRIEDNPALSAAAKSGRVLPVFIWCPEEEAQFFPGRVSRWWLKQSLIHLNKSLKSIGVPLTFIKAESTLSALLRCVLVTGAKRVMYNHLYDPVSIVRDHKIKSRLTESGLTVRSFNADLLYEPWEVYDEDGFAFTHFDAFWDKCMSLPMEPNLLLPPWKLHPASGLDALPSCSIEELGLENDAEKSSNALLSRAWAPGWSNADKQLAEFNDNHLVSYARNRMKVDGAATSLLSPYLHFGELSVRKVYQSVRMKQIQWGKEESAEASESAEVFLRAIGLREYSRYLCFNFPFTHERALLGHLKHYPWRADEAQFKAWRQGRTGYPLVDAGMRELWATGWIHNRTRVVVSSFFVKFLLLPWTWGMKYFWDTLLDADLESDVLGWQYISGSLPDGHELTRIDSPEVQGRSLDPEGEYVRQWLPELARVPTEWIHRPWDAPESVLSAAGVELGLNYPEPIVDMSTAERRLGRAIARMWELDRAARRSGPAEEEVVADNMAAHDLPRVALLRKSPPGESYSADQRVPSMHHPRAGLHRPAPAGSRVSKGDEDLRSTAESSSARKRGASESLCAVPHSSSSEVDFHGPTRLCRDAYDNGRSRRDMEVGEEDVQSSVEGLRPCKRPA